MPREMTAEGYRGFIDQGLAAVRALGVGDAMTHMEGSCIDGGRSASPTRRSGRPGADRADAGLRLRRRPLPRLGARRGGRLF